MNQSAALMANWLADSPVKTTPAQPAEELPEAMKASVFELENSELDNKKDECFSDDNDGKDEEAEVGNDDDVQFDEHSHKPATIEDWFCKEPEEKKRKSCPAVMIKSSTTPTREAKTPPPSTVGTPPKEEDFDDQDLLIGEFDGNNNLSYNKVTPPKQPKRVQSSLDAFFSAS